MISIVTPAFNETANLPALYDELAATMARLGGGWEWVIVDDHSGDDTFATIGRLAARDARVRGIRLARNSGSHLALSCGLHHANGEAVVMMAADRQDPPETIPLLVERWRAGAHIVWAVRRERPGDASHAGFAAIYYAIMRHVVGLKEMPARGADFFLADRAVVDAFKRFPERNVSVFALLTWMGFRQEAIEYDKRPRAAGVSGWTLARKVKLVIDSITAFSDLPIRLSLYAGTGFVAAALLLAAVALARLGRGGAGLTAAAALVIGLAGAQLLALGLIGQYVWRAFDEARRRPAYLVEAEVALDGGIQSRAQHAVE
jgi:dolichol-phosphate mannosyltransferase